MRYIKIIVFCIGLLLPMETAVAAPEKTLIPTINIINVVQNDEVTIRTHNFPAGKSFNVLMGKIGTRGIGGLFVTTFDSEDGGSLTATFSIPPDLFTETMISIRLEDPISGYYSYDWFYNNDGNLATPPATWTWLPPCVYPTFSIEAVVVDKEVTIRTKNFPANDTYNVLLGTFGTRAIGGILIGTQDSGSGGTFNASYEIPEEFKGVEYIAIRLESPQSGYYAFNWFKNFEGSSQTSTGSPGGQISTIVIPIFYISSVSKDGTVTIEAKNFPSNDVYDVRMGLIGTRGSGGVKVGTQNSGSDGTFTATYTIPKSLYGKRQIAIRLESPTSGYYSYNWFFNNDT
jgi:hypothetical protein